MIALPKLQSVIEESKTGFSMLMVGIVLYLCFLMLGESHSVRDVIVWGPSIAAVVIFAFIWRLNRYSDWNLIGAVVALISGSALAIVWEVVPSSDCFSYLAFGGILCAFSDSVLAGDRFFACLNRNRQEREFPAMLGVLNTLVGGCASCVFLYFLCRYQSWGDEIRPLPYVDFPSLTSASSLGAALNLNMLVAVAASILLIGILQLASASAMSARGEKYALSLEDLLLQASFVTLFSSWMMLLSCTIYLVCSHGYVSLIARDCIRSTHGFLEAMVVIVPIFALLVTLVTKARSLCLRVLSVFALTLFVGIGAVCTFAPRDGVPWDVRFDMWSGRLQSALAKTDSMLKTDEKNYRLYELKAGILESLGQVEQSRLAYSQAFEHGSRSYFAFEARIFRKVEEKRYDAAFATCNELMRYYPGSAAARGDLAYVYERMGNNDKANEKFSIVARMEPKYRFDGWSIALCNSRLRQSGRVEAVAQQEIDRCPYGGYGYYWMSKAMLSQGRYHEAISNAEKDIRLYPLSASSYELLARAYFELGINDLALKYYNNAIVLGKKRGSNYYYRSMIYERMGLKDKALKDKQMYKSLGFDPLKDV